MRPHTIFLMGPMLIGALLDNLSPWEEEQLRPLAGETVEAPGRRDQSCPWEGKKLGPPGGGIGGADCHDTVPTQKTLNVFSGLRPHTIHLMGPILMGTLADT